ncbi:MAG: hypothetical protein ABI433_09995 [Burkholderiaceae bacterium]
MSATDQAGIVTGDIVDIAAAIASRVIGPAGSRIQAQGGDDEAQKFLMCIVTLVLSMARDRLGVPPSAMAAEALEHLGKAGS